MGAVSRARADLRRARRAVRKLEEEHAEVLEDLADGMGDLDADGVSSILRGLDTFERTLATERERLIGLENELEIAMAARREKRRDAWEDVRAALRRFGPSIVDVLGDVAQVLASPRDQRILIASEALLEHANIDIAAADVASLAERIVDALED